MKILFIAQEPLLRADEVVSGNAIRIGQLRTALQQEGHELLHCWLSGPGVENSRTPAAESSSFSSRDELQGIILAKAPDVILLTYWELAALLPFDLRQPVVLDFIAPRPLEELFEQADTVRASMRRLTALLQRCDLVLVGNDVQRHLLINTLIEAGFDLRQELPVKVVPLGAKPAERTACEPADGAWVLVAGGVSWPWRRSENYLHALAEAADGNRQDVRIVQFGGAYRLHAPASAKEPSDESDQFTPSAIERQSLQPYRQYSEFLSEQAHVGVELADWNIERAYSQSFRSLEFLRHGLPILCNRYLPLASLIKSYNAGWLVDSPDQLQESLARITTSREEWKTRSAGALRLVNEVLSPEHSVKPLVDWLNSAHRAARLPAEPDLAPPDPVLGVPPLVERIKRQFHLVRQVGLSKLMGQARPGPGVLFVTRGDLFPVDHGAAVRTVETARALANLGLPVGIVTDDSKHWYELKHNEFQKRRFSLWLRLLSLPGPLLKLLHYSKDLPHSNSFLYLPLTDGGFFWRILAAGRSIRAGVLQAEFPAYAKPCIEARDILHAKVVLVQHNVEYERLRTQVPELTEAQYTNLRAIELNLCHRSDAVVCVSDNDRQTLIDQGINPQRLHTISHGVHLDNYRANAEAGVHQRFDIAENEPLLVFHGTFSYPPNRKALQIFAETLLPGLDRAGLRCHVLAVGREPPPASPHERIHFTGSVTDVAPWLKAADMSVIPLTDGGGTRMKIADCFAAGLPVISTSKGIEGIPVEPGKQALVIDDWNEMIEAIVDLWQHPDRRTELAEAAHAMAADLDWSAVGRRYKSVYSNV